MLVFTSRRSTPKPLFMNRIRHLREARGLTLAELAEQVGTSHATIQRLESGKMRLTQEWAERISAALAVHMPEIFGEIVPAVAKGLDVLGDVQAGVWREVDVADELKYPPLPIGPDPRYSPIKQFALRVRGESMNKTVRDGAYIVCVTWAELGRGPRDNDLVVVERRRDGLVETTVKRIRLENKKVLLLPDSDDPRWQTPLVLEGGLENDEIAVIALVIGKYETLA
jgi:transcriptional regulator with XRE-family HTH domain